MNGADWPLPESSESSEATAADDPMVEDAMSPSQTLTVADLTTTLPEPSAGTTRYLGLLYADDMVTTPDRPYVLATLEDAHQLLAAAYWGWTHDVREMHVGTILERTMTFPGTDSPELMLWRVRVLETRPDFDIDYPQLKVTIGPKGGISHERI